MALPSGADVEIGGVGFKLDQGYERITGRRCYAHGGRSIFAGRTDITGRPGSQNLKEDYLLEAYTRFDGEGQAVIDPSDQGSAFRFYRSEGLNFRTAGQAKLNRSAIAEQVKTTTSDTTAQGSAFTDVTGTFSTINTNDAQLQAVADQIIDDTGQVNPGAISCSVDFHIYRQSYANNATTVAGNDLKVRKGETTTSGTDIILRSGASVWTAKLDAAASGEELDSDGTVEVRFYAYVSPASGFGNTITSFLIYDVTNPDNPKVVASTTGPITNNTDYDSGTPTRTLNFQPVSGRDYRFAVTYNYTPSGWTATVDQITYGPSVIENTAYLEVYDGTSVVAKKTVTINSTSTTDAVNKVATLTYTGSASKTFKARVKWLAGAQKIAVDKVVYHAQTGAVWEIDCLDFGPGSLVWLGAHSATGTTNSKAFKYDVTNDEWDSVADFNDGATTYDAAVLAMAHSETLEYFLLDNNEVYTSTTGGTDDRFAYFSGNAKNLVGMTVAQNRLWLLSDDTTYAGSTIYSLPLDDVSTNPWDLNLAALSTGVRYTTLPTGTRSSDESIRQRMASSPTGARFFVNYGDATAKVYEVDGSGTTLAPREIADLGTGVKATSITYESGWTFVGGLYYGDAGTAASSTDVDLLARPVLFGIDPNGVPVRMGFFRRDDPAAGPPQYIVPYQTDLYILQSGIDAAGTSHAYVWRYSLTTGGLYLEYELEPTTASAQQSLAVIAGRLFAAFTSEVFVAGSVQSFRQSSVAGGNAITSSITDYGLPGMKKALARIDVTTDELPSNTSVMVEYQIDQNGTWTFGGVHGTGSQQSFYFEDVSFFTIQLRTTLITVDGASTPTLLGTTVWAAAAEDEEYFDLVLLTEDQDSYFHIAGEQVPGAAKSGHIVSLWREKSVTTLRDGYGGGDDAYLGTIEDLRVEQNADGEGRTVVTFKVLR